MAIRKNARNLSSTEKAELVSAIRAIKASGRYNQYVLAHAQATMSAIHRCPAFLPWHRQFLVEYEKDLQLAAGNQNLGLPYWNWAEDAAMADPRTSSIWAADLMGGDGDASDSYVVKTGPFREGQWTIVDSMGNPAGPLQRAFGLNAPTLPAQADVDSTLNTVPYDASPWNTSSQPSFRNRLEGWYGATGPGMHNRGHVWVGGSMLPMTSPNDPVFFLHHCFVDKLWADWQARNPGLSYLPQTGGPAGQNENNLMFATVTGQSTIATVLDIATLGYSYDQTPGGASTGTGTGSGGRGGVCFIATAVYGSQDAAEVKFFRNFRDRYLSPSLAGRVAIASYYRVSPVVAKQIRRSETSRRIIRSLFLEPLRKLLVRLTAR